MLTQASRHTGVPKAVAGALQRPAAGPRRMPRRPENARLLSDISRGIVTEMGWGKFAAAKPRLACDSDNEEGPDSSSGDDDGNAYRGATRAGRGASVAALHSKEHARAAMELVEYLTADMDDDDAAGPLTPEPSAQPSAARRRQSGYA